MSTVSPDHLEDIRRLSGSTKYKNSGCKYHKLVSEKRFTPTRRRLGNRDKFGRNLVMCCFFNAEVKERVEP